MKPNNGHGAVRALGGRIAAVLLGVVCALCVSATPALAAESSITNARTGKTYDKLADATADAQSGDTIKLGEGNYTLYGVSSVGHTKGKDLTFEGLGADKTAWNIGALVPDPANYGTEYNGDYSFDGAGTVTFKNMTLRSGAADYLGFIRANNTVVNNCIVNGKTFYWGYTSAEFNNTTFNAPGKDYSLWTYSSPIMTFNGCTFNCAGKAINVYTDYSAGTHDITVNVNSCTFNSTATAKTALNINDKNMGDFKYKVNIAGATTATGLETDPYTCSKVFGFGGYAGAFKGQNSGRTNVTIDGKPVWTAGKMVNHDYTDGEHEDAFNVTYTEWTSDDAGTWTRTGTPKCKYCGFTKPEFEEKAFDLSYDMNGSDDKQPADFATVECVTEAEVVTDQPIRDGYSFEGWNTAKDGSGTSYAAGDKVELAAPMTLYAQWKKNEPAPQPKPAEPEPNKPGENTQKPAQKKVKSSVPATGDSINAALPVAAAIAGVALVGVVAIRKRDEH
ncbi:MAG: InlB B-repeat-containing protein [Paratractidigestivibacter faecalis]|uniref:InlB B-repeat-containing protein n=1 Tax=Paratractidigestivibacter faecalis TaxID=2292441 RepID=UPI0026F34C4B|nr:InlB B-repeat-containing protein [Paratractidigestivibacter faecalis]MDD6417950.1 InlB B-repeat-containing protein [Paratractidigestivibacter faecalis]